MSCRGVIVVKSVVFRVWPNGGVECCLKLFRLQVQVEVANGSDANPFINVFSVNAAA